MELVVKMAGIKEHAGHYVQKIYWCHQQINNEYYKFNFIKTGWEIINIIYDEK